MTEANNQVNEVNLDPNQEYHYKGSDVDNLQEAKEVTAGSIIRHFKTLSFKNPKEIKSALEAIASDIASLIKQMNLAKLWEYRFVKILVLIVSVLILFKILTWSGDQNSSKDAQQAAQLAMQQGNNAIKLERSGVTTTTPINIDMNNNLEATASLEPPVSSDQALNDRVGTLERATEYALGTLDEINKRSQENQQFLGILGNYTAKMGNIWQDAVKDKRNAKIIRSRLLYTIYSMNAERAWLIDQFGHMISVDVGSRIPGYGKVLRLLPRSGRVITDNAIISWTLNQ